MTLQEFIDELNSIKDSLKNNQIKLIKPNGILTTPDIKFKLKDEMDSLNLSNENVEYIVIK